eukprot:8469851-Pyramimonas_sp.AAC.1
MYESEAALANQHRPAVVLTISARAVSAPVGGARGERELLARETSSQKKLERTRKTGRAGGGVRPALLSYTAHPYHTTPRRDQL